MYGEGPVNGALVVGFAPSDADQDRPFTSKSGLYLRRALAKTGLDARLEYLVPFAAPPHKLFHAGLPNEQLVRCIDTLKQTVALVQPKVVVLLGEHVLRAVTSYTNLATTHCYVITDNKLNVPAIPTYSPNDLFKDPANSYWLGYALQKAKALLDGKQDKPYNAIVHNDFERTKAFLQNAAESDRVSIDIETIMNKDVITAISVCGSNAPDNVISFSNTPEDRLTQQQWLTLCGCVKSIMENQFIEKIGQNFLFDALMLKRVLGIECYGPVWDIMHCSNILYSDLKKSLEDQARLWLYCSPWKGGWRHTGEQLRIYNAQDTILTYRIALAQQERLEQLGLMNYFTTVPKKLWQPAKRLSERGIRVDVQYKEQLAVTAQKTLNDICAKLQSYAADKVSLGVKKKKKRSPENDIATGFHVSAQKANPADVLSAVPIKERKEYYVPKQKDVERYGYQPLTVYKKSYREHIEHYKRPFNPSSGSQVASVLKNAGVALPKVKQQHTKLWAESTNEKALAKLLQRAKDPEVLDFIQNMIIYRHGAKLITSYLNAKLDDDHRWRCFYNIEGTDTGRSSSRQTPWRTGGNNQNVPRDGFMGLKFKNVFIADEGYTLFQSDQSGAEALIVAYLSRCRRLIDYIERGEDPHLHTLAAFSGKSYADLVALKRAGDKTVLADRQKIKPIAHGYNYNMGVATLVETMVKSGINIDAKEAQRLMNQYAELYPEIRDNFHAEIQAQLQENRTLVTPFGRRRVFLGKLDDHLYRKAYAHTPQSTVPHITNLMWLWVETHLPSVQVLQMGHDALLMQVPEQELDSAVERFLNQTQNIKFTIGDYRINIPWDAQIGSRWGSLSDYKKGE